MTWQAAITLQVVVSSFMTLFTRRLTLTVTQVFFGVGMVSYATVASSGLILSIINNGGSPVLPTGNAWLYLAIEGLCIPLSWLMQYKLIRYIGAANAVIVSALNTVGAALLGILFLKDGLSTWFILGAALIILSSLVSLRIRPDTEHGIAASLPIKVALALAGAAFFALGMFAEKQAITTIGVWNYTAFGWGMQAVGALLIFICFGLKEIPHLRKGVIIKGIMLGLITSVAGALYVYALSKGELSRTVVAASGKVAITMLLAAVLLKERNAIWLRLLAFLLSVSGLLFIIK